MGTTSDRRSWLGRSREILRYVAELGSGLGTSLLALGVLVLLVLVALLSVVGVGLLLAPAALRAVRWIADRERTRLARWGTAVPGPAALPSGLRAALADPTVRRDIAWLTVHATWGLLIGFVGVALPLFTVRDLTFPLWWWLAPEGEASAALWFWVVDSWPEALLVALSALGWGLLTVLLAPALARVQSRPGRALLPPPPGTDLPLRIAELTATRAAALDAHATELRRIERCLHDGTQNPLVAANVLIGAARRQLGDDRPAADDLLEQAQTAIERALGELRTTIRGILPPVLSDRGLDGALTGLAATSSVPTTVDVGATRCPASVEASAYFMVAEALTNISRHSGAERASVTVRSIAGDLDVTVTDDGHGGATEGTGSGLGGIRRRIEAHDGTFEVSSPPGGPTTLHARLPCGS
ncbi:sensor histidine kinase [Aeromicrobium sp. S22]|uniref:sensor histidine kinase n=1 Tax=Aeromicrobium sp. S22 TaxID=2662029 RepID=UPI00129D663D|nr:sensor domain-containing protein [Aeromicrobium sp. S22]MRK03061.1 sensor histidine kinase [Aeromicrobium sp. S22]